MRMRHSCPALAAVLAATSLTLAGGAASGAVGATAERIGVLDHATLTIDGRGYGHGHGMSQWGTQGAALQGLSAKRIVEFYYPHTRAGLVGGKVRVLICGDTDNNTTVVNGPGLEVRDLGNGKTMTLPTSGAAGHASRWRCLLGVAARPRCPSAPTAGTCGGA